MTDGWVGKLTIDGLPYYYNEQSEEITWDKPDALRTAQEIEEESGEWTWVPHPKQLWQPARIVSRNANGSVTTQTQAGKEIIIPVDGMLDGALTGGRKVKVELWPLKISSLKRAEEDLVRLNSLNDAAIINNIRLRYENDELYTWVGASRSVLISVNPFKKLPLYGSKEIKLYRAPPPNTHLAPHTYDIANDSYNSLLFDNKNQSILISGESGAGKTVCTKQCLNFLAEVAGSESDIEEMILAANPVLEAFGNAQTIRNNNSSRFGKWIEVYFDPMERCISSAKIINYLLEKSRLVYQQKGERNYHVFYQLTKDSSMRSKYGLQSADNYRYTNQSGVYDAHLIDDGEDFAAVNEAMELLKFSKEEQDWVFSLTSGILTLGNTTFKEKKEKGGVSGSDVNDRASVDIAAKLMGVDAEELQHVLNYRSITVRGQKATIPLDPEKARSGCDSLAMGIYGRLFDWLVQKINVSLDGKRGKFIGILDIFGFEIFDQNSFEQLCINFANEKLQQQFNRTTFKEEEALYMAEGINYKHIEFIDNQVVLDMIEKAPRGILPMLDDECKIPEGADSKFMNKIEEVHQRNDRFQTDTHRKLQDSFNFEILHYAGIVKYNGDGFMVKNTDNLFQDMYHMCSKSEVPQMQKLFPKNENRRQMKSLSFQFRSQLNELMSALYETESRYIRCVKPNPDQKPNSFVSGMSIDQLRYSGVFEAVDIRKQGYPFRYKFAQFACRYSCINRGHKYSAGRNNYRAICEELLNVNKQEFKDVVFGKTMVLYRTAEYSTLELLRNLALESVIPKMQAAMRGHLAREIKRRCFKLRDGIDAALKKQNDLDMLIAAIEAVGPTIAEMKDLFPGILPLNLEAGKKHRDDLQKWRDLEHELETLLNQDANDVYYDLAKATDRAEDLRAIPQTDKQMGLVEEALSARANCERGKIDNEAKDCLAVLDPDRMNAVVERAGKIAGHTSRELEEIKEKLALPEIDFVQLEIEKAKEMGDEKRRIHREIRYKELFIEQNERQYSPLSSYSKLREPMEYAKASFLAKFMGAEKKAQEMLLWTKPGSLTSLTNITGNPAQVKAAKQISKFVRQYMGEKKFPEPDEAARQLVATAQQNSLQDEAMLQVFKQLNNNPNPESVTKGWQLLGYVLLNLRPSEDFENFVYVYLKQNAPENDYRRYNSFMHTLQYGKAVNSVGEAVKMVRDGEGRSRFSITAEERTGPTAA